MRTAQVPAEAAGEAVALTRSQSLLRQVRAVPETYICYRLGLVFLGCLL